MNNTKTFNVMDLFCGAGGLSEGFSQTNKFTIKAAVEINKNAQETYKYNHKKYFDSDFKMYPNIKDINVKNEQGEIKKEFKNIDIVIGGPPCQGFSNANRQKNTLISGNNELVKEFLRIIEDLRPKAFVMENVRTMDSKVHKFFYSATEEAELNDLNIKVKSEQVVIGKSTNLTKSLVNSLKLVGLESINKYSMEEKLLNKLKSLYNLIKKMDFNAITKYFEQNKNYIQLNLPKEIWLNKHLLYLNNDYKNEWTLLNKLLSIAFNNMNQYAIYYSSIIIEELIEFQKIILKFQEIKKYNIDINMNNIVYDNKNIEISIKSYNVFEYIKAKLKSLDYEINEDDFLLNAAEFGVPQVRKRLFIMGIHKSKNPVTLPSPLKDKFYLIKHAIYDLQEITPATETNHEEILKTSDCLNNKLNRYLSVPKGEPLYNHVMTKTREISQKRFNKLTAGQNFHDLDDSLKTTYSDHSRTQNTIYKRLSYESTSDTVVNVRKSMWIHPTKNRALSIREAARLQSFQDTYKFIGTKDSQYQQVGNAVPPLLARAVAERLLELLGEKVDEKISDII
jgi:DNA (cytosine-5)-methyltransferase 1